jgi:hypothetical protein
MADSKKDIEIIHGMTHEEYMDSIKPPLIYFD